MTRLVSIGGIALAVLILAYGGIQISKRVSPSRVKVLQEPPKPTPTSDKIPDPFPGDNIKITLLKLKAIETNDGGATGDADEVYTNVFRGVGINQNILKKLNWAVQSE